MSSCVDLNLVEEKTLSIVSNCQYVDNKNLPSSFHGCNWFPRIASDIETLATTKKNTGINFLQLIDVCVSWSRTLTCNAFHHFHRHNTILRQVLPLQHCYVSMTCSELPTNDRRADRNLLIGKNLFNYRIRMTMNNLMRINTFDGCMEGGRIVATQRVDAMIKYSQTTISSSCVHWRARAPYAS